MLSIHVLRPHHTVQYIFLATCNAILLMVDVKLANTRLHHSLLIKNILNISNIRH